MKLVMTLNPDMPKTRRVPLHPKTGKPWKERDEEICAAQMALRTIVDGEEWKACAGRILDLSEGLLFQEVPYIKEADEVIGPDDGERYFFCHPKTWAKLPREQKARFEVHRIE